MDKELEQKPVAIPVRNRDGCVLCDETYRFQDSLDTKLRHLVSTDSAESEERGMVEGESMGSENIPARRSICKVVSGHEA